MPSRHTKEQKTTDTGQKRNWKRIDRLIPEELLQTPDFQRRARLLVSFTLLVCFMGPTFSLIHFSMGRYQQGSLNLFFTILISSVLLLLKRTKSLFFAGNILILGLFGTLYTLSYYTGGHQAPQLYWTIGIPLIAVLLLGKRTGSFWLIFCMLGILTFYTLHFYQSSIRPPHSQVVLIHWTLSTLALATLLYFLARIFETAKTDALNQVNKINEKLQQTLEKLQQSNQALQIARREAEKANQAKSAFLANMSHEIRTPLTAIIGYTEILQEEFTHPEELEVTLLDRDVQRIASSSQHLLQLINNILDLSKIEAGKMKLEHVEFAIEDFVKDTIVQLGNLPEKNKNELDIHFDLTQQTMHSDPLRLRQILLNLLSNACKFTHQGTIQIHSWNRGEKLHFLIKDNGIGMSEDELDKVFQEFSQATNSTSRKFGGTGLGLTLCKRLCTLLGGHIHVQSQPGSGTSFQLTFPK